MNVLPQRITLDDWDQRYAELCRDGLCEPAYGGCLRRHVDDGDRRLLRLRLDNSAAALRLWNFLLTEEDRLRQSQAAGKRLVGTLKDLGTVPVLAYAFDNLVAFFSLCCAQHNFNYVAKTVMWRPLSTCPFLNSLARWNAT